MMLTADGHAGFIVLVCGALMARAARYARWRDKTRHGFS